eukprot:TRINITY_DN11171_c0_g1_i3.p1 TRINITY_DN11171_c0_g1~~TRINITY_DN11171_c0_g1_i3.p1  ORF type:complete len:1059 (+),score=353.55 TRINITY_DN11171_c0_g1_i3:824-4000(+)
MQVEERLQGCIAQYNQAQRWLQNSLQREEQQGLRIQASNRQLNQSQRWLQASLATEQAATARLEASNKQYNQSQRWLQQSLQLADSRQQQLQQTINTLNKSQRWLQDSLATSHANGRTLTKGSPPSREHMDSRSQNQHEGVDAQSPVIDRQASRTKGDMLSAQLQVTIAQYNRSQRHIQSLLKAKTQAEKRLQTTISDFNTTQRRLQDALHTANMHPNNAHVAGSPQDAIKDESRHTPSVQNEIVTQQASDVELVSTGEGSDMAARVAALEAQVAQYHTRLQASNRQYNQAQRWLQASLKRDRDHQRRSAASNRQLNQSQRWLQASLAKEQAALARLEASNKQFNQSQRWLQESKRRESATLDRLEAGKKSYNHSQRQLQQALLLASSRQQQLQHTTNTLNKSQRWLQQALAKSDDGTEGHDTLQSQLLAERAAKDSYEQRLVASFTDYNRIQRQLQQALLEDGSATLANSSSLHKDYDNIGHDQIQQRERSLPGRSLPDEDDTTDKVAELEEEINVLTTDLDELNQELADLQQSHKDELSALKLRHKKRLEEKEAELTALQTEARQMKAKVAAVDQGSQERQAMVAQIQTLHAEMATARKQHTAKVDALKAQFQEGMEQLEQQLQTAQDDKEEAERKLGLARKDVQTCAAEVQRLQSELQEVKHELSREQEAKQTASTELKNGQRAVEELKAKHAIELEAIEASHLAAMAEQATRKDTALQQELGDKARLIAELQAEIQALQLSAQQAMQAEDSTILASKQREEQLQQQLNTLESAQVAALESLQQQLEDMTERSNMLEDELSSTTSALQSLQYDKEQQEAEHSTALDDKQHEIEALREQLKELRRKHDALLALPQQPSESVLERSSGIIGSDSGDLLDHSQYSEIGLHDETSARALDPAALPSADAMVHQLERAQTAASRELQQLQERNEALMRDKTALERASIDHSHQVQTLEQEIGVLKKQLDTLLAESQLSNKRSRGLPGISDEVVVELGDDGENANPSNARRESSAAMEALDGLNNCVRLVTDGKISRKTAMTYLASVHALLLFMLVKCLLL